jgi:short-subunit dehydrogenase
MKLRGKVFVVTGGGNGIGREVVLELLARGARVAAVDLRADGLAETVGLAGTNAPRLSTHTVDITDRAAVAALPAAVESGHGGVDGLVNVAGIIQRFVPVAELDFADMEKVMAVNFWGVVYTTKAFLPVLLTRPQACIVNVSSMGGFAPVPGQTVYGASKAAVKLFTEGLYAELRATPVAVTVVFPGGVATRITHNSGVDIPSVGADQSSMVMTTPADAARQILAGIEKGSYRVVIGKDARGLDAMTRLAPQRATNFVATKMASLLAR